MNIDNLTEEQIKFLERQKLMKKFTPTGLHPDRVTYDSMDESQIKSLEAQRKRYEPLPTGLHPDRVTYDSMDESQIELLEAQRKRYEPLPTGLHPDRVTYDSMDESQIKSLEAQRKRYEPLPTGLHPDRVTYDSMDESQIKSLEAQRNRYEPLPTGLHPDRVTYDNMDESQIKSLEAQVFERKQTDIPYKEYFNNLIENQIIENEEVFKEAVVRSMQSNQLMQTFTNDIIEKIGQKTIDFKSIDKSDKELVEKSKKEIESLVYIYERYMYALKENGWSFSSYGLDVTSMSIPEDIKENIWKLQKEFDVTFNIAIPADMGEDYGKAFERQGKMIPGLTLMSDELRGKEINWHQVMIYYENELTPSQRFRSR